MSSEKITDPSRSSDDRRSRWYDDACGTALALEFVGERWSLLVMRELLLGSRRFGELRRSLPGLSANILTQRLQGLEADGIVERRRLPSPVNAQVYALTPWGYESEPIIMAMGRWALRSPRHDPTLTFSPSALLLSMRMLLRPERAGDWQALVGMEVGGEGFVARLADGALAVARGETSDAAARLAGKASVFLPVLYGAMPLAAAEAAGMLAVEGNRAVAERFVTLFALPDKLGG